MYLPHSENNALFYPVLVFLCKIRDFRAKSIQVLDEFFIPGLGSGPHVSIVGLEDRGIKL